MIILYEISILIEVKIECIHQNNPEQLFITNRFIQNLFHSNALAELKCLIVWEGGESDYFAFVIHLWFIILINLFQIFLQLNDFFACFVSILDGHPYVHDYQFVQSFAFWIVAFFYKVLFEKVDGFLSVPSYVHIYFHVFFLFINDIRSKIRLISSCKWRFLDFDFLKKRSEKSKIEIIVISY